MEFIEQPLTWNRLRAQGVTSTEEPAGELHLDLDESTAVVAFDLAAREFSGTVPAGVLRVPRAEIGPIVEGIVHKLKLPEVVVIPVGRWRDVFNAVATPMSTHEQWRAIDAAAMVELNTRDPLLFGPAHHHLLRDLVDAVVDAGDGIAVDQRGGHRRARGDRGHPGRPADRPGRRRAPGGTRPRGHRPSFGTGVTSGSRGAGSAPSCGSPSLS